MAIKIGTGLVSCNSQSSSWYTTKSHYNFSERNLQKISVLIWSKTIALSLVWEIYRSYPLYRVIGIIDGSFIIVTMTTREMPC